MGVILSRYKNALRGGLVFFAYGRSQCPGHRIPQRSPGMKQWQPRPPDLTLTSKHLALDMRNNRIRVLFVLRSSNALSKRGSTSGAWMRVHRPEAAVPPTFIIWRRFGRSCNLRGKYSSFITEGVSGVAILGVLLDKFAPNKRGSTPCGNIIGNTWHCLTAYSERTKTDYGDKWKRYT